MCYWSGVSLFAIVIRMYNFVSCFDMSYHMRVPLLLDESFSPIAWAPCLTSNIDSYSSIITVMSSGERAEWRMHIWNFWSACAAEDTKVFSYSFREVALLFFPDTLGSKQKDTWFVRNSISSRGNPWNTGREVDASLSSAAALLLTFFVSWL